MKPINDAEKNLASLLRDVGDMELNLSEVVDLVKEFAYPDPTNNWDVNSACIRCPPQPARPEFIDYVMGKIIKKKIAFYWIGNNRVKEVLTGIRHPIMAIDTGPLIGRILGKQVVGIAQSSHRFATQGVGDKSLDVFLYANDRRYLEGTEVNAFRHALWQALTTHYYGFDLAEKAGFSHEKKPWANITDQDLSVIDKEKSVNFGFPNPKDMLIKHKNTMNALNGREEDSDEYQSWVEKGIKKTYYSELDADEVIDLFNNEIGRNIGKEYSNNKNTDYKPLYSFEIPERHMKNMAFKVLDEFYEAGLYLMIVRDDGMFGIEKVQLPIEKYEYMKEVFNNLDEFVILPFLGQI